MRLRPPPGPPGPAMRSPPAASPHRWPAPETPPPSSHGAAAPPGELRGRDIL